MATRAPLLVVRLCLVAFLPLVAGCLGPSLPAAEAPAAPATAPADGFKPDHPEAPAQAARGRVEIHEWSGRLEPRACVPSGDNACTVVPPQGVPGRDDKPHHAHALVPGGDALAARFRLSWSGSLPEADHLYLLVVCMGADGQRCPGAAREVAFARGVHSPIEAAAIGLPSLREGDAYYVSVGPARPTGPPVAVWWNTDVAFQVRAELLVLG